MRSITVLAALVIILSGISPVAAEEPEKSLFSVTPRLGILLGQAEEIVYSNGTSYHDVLSELLWDVKTIFYYGLDIEFSPAQPLRRRGAFVTVSMKYAVPARSGVMEDRDWRSKVNNALTDYSRQDNYLDELFLLDACAGYSFPLGKIFTIKPQFLLSYMHFGFLGMNGYGIYTKPSYWDRPDFYYMMEGTYSVEEFNGKVISYSQDWLILSTGVSFGVQFLKYFFFEIGFNISPLIVCVDLDLHIGQQHQFKDHVLGGLFVEPRAALTFAVNKWISISLNALYRNISGARGSAYDRYIQSQSVFSFSGESGTGLSLFDAGLTLNIRF